MDEEINMSNKNKIKISNDIGNEYTENGYESEGIKNEIRDYWNNVREHAFFENDAEEKLWRKALINELGVEKRKILDVGTGNGSLSLLLAELGHDVVGIDLSEGMLSVARKKANERGVSLDLRIGDAESLDFESERFDVVVSRLVLWTLPHPEKAIAEWSRVLSSGGNAYSFEVESWGRKSGIDNWIKRTLGLLMITAVERKNAWKMAHYSKDVNKRLPLSYDKGSSSIINRLELFRKSGFENVTAFKMAEVSELCQKQEEETPLRYKLAWGDKDNCRWYYIKGDKK